LNEPVTLFVTITSPVDVLKVDKYGLNAEIIFPREEYEILDGCNIVPVTIKAGETIHFSVVVAFKKAGLWPITACVSELIVSGSGPAGIYHYSPKDTIFFEVE
jgi:hypothetical protein